MNSTDTVHQLLTPDQILADNRADTITMPLLWVSSGIDTKPQVGSRYAVIFQQGRFGSPLNKQQTYADLLTPSRMEHLGTDPKPGWTWGWDDVDGPHQFAFTIVGVYILDSIVPDLEELTFSALFRLEGAAA